MREMERYTNGTHSAFVDSEDESVSGFDAPTRFRAD